ncbi:RICIN domain-containing protein, partial [Streptomyces sp. NPDC059627]
PALRPPPPAPRAAPRPARRVRRRNLTVAVATVSGLVVLPLVLWSVLGSGDDGSSAAAKPSATPAGTATSGPSWIGTSRTTQGTLRGRLHNIASGLCIGVVGKKAVKGAETALTECSSVASQQWTYEGDGLLRNAAAPELCLDSHLGYSVQLAPCTAATASKAGKSVHYDFTLQGALIPRWDQDLALAPAATDGGGALVVKTRASVSAQRWVMDTSQPDLQMQIVNWDADTTPTPTATPTPTTKAAKPATSAPTPSASKTTAQPTPSSTSSYNPCVEYPGYCYGQGDGQYGGGWGDGGGYGGGGGGGGHHGGH